METTLDIRAASDNLTDLQTESLGRIALFLGPIGYVWLTLLVWPITRGNAPATAWGGVGLLLLSVTLSYALRARALRLASLVLVLGTLGTVALAALGRAPDVRYLLILPVIFASVLLSQGLVFLVAGLASIVAVAVNRGGSGCRCSLWPARYP